jgi:hypothetical protein
MRRANALQIVRVTLHCRPSTMTTPPDDARAAFEHFSSEYAQALQAFQTIESQAPTLMLMGNHDELRQFIDQFIEMSTRTRLQALEKDEQNFVDWFGELIQKAQTMRASIPH